MSRYEQGGDLPPFALQHKKKLRLAAKYLLAVELLRNATDESGQPVGYAIELAGFFQGRSNC
jgi:hypothetical protein